MYAELIILISCYTCALYIKVKIDAQVRLTSAHVTLESSVDIRNVQTEIVEAMYYGIKGNLNSEARNDLGACSLSICLRCFSDMKIPVRNFKVVRRRVISKRDSLRNV